MLMQAAKKVDALCRRGAGLWAGLPAAVRFVLGVALAYVVWRHRSWLLQDVILWAGVVCAAARYPRGWSAWRSVPGVVGLLCLAWVVLQAPFGTHPALAAGDMFKSADTVFFALAMPALLSGITPFRNALACSACALTAVIGYDLVRLAVLLGPNRMAEAHAYEPFAWLHSNISAMAAGMAALALLHLAWLLRRRRGIAACAVAAAVVNIAYLAVIGSRGPQIAFAGALLTAMVVYPRGWKWRVALALLALIAGVSLVAARERINPRFADVGSLRGLVDRDKVWQHTWVLIQERPIVGHGHGEKVFRADYHTDAAPASPHRFRHPHQYFLGVFFSYGLVGLLLVSALWVTLMARLLRAIATTDHPPQRVLACAVLTLLTFVHIFALADCPTNVTAVAMIWLVPAGLIVTRREDALA